MPLLFCSNHFSLCQNSLKKTRFASKVLTLLKRPTFLTTEGKLEKLKWERR